MTLFATLLVWIRSWFRAPEPPITDAYRRYYKDGYPDPRD